MGVKCPNCNAEHEGWVPKERLDTVAEQRRQIEAELTTTKSEVSEWKTKWESASGDLAQLEAYKNQVAEYQGKESSWTVERSILRSGITSDEGIDFARLAWDRLPEDKRPEGGIESWLNNSEALPHGVKVYLPQSQARVEPEAPKVETTTTQVSPETQQQQPPPRGSSTVVPGGNAAGQPTFTREQILAMSPEEYAAHREAIQASFRR